MPSFEAPPRQSGIAIIGMACRFPGAEGPDELWRNLVDGVESITTGPNRDDREGFTGGFIAEPFAFDNEYFGISEEESVYLDPQQRILLELAAETMHAASYGTLAGRRVGMFVGASQTSYEEQMTGRLYRNAAIDEIRQHPALLAMGDDVRPRILALLDEIELPWPNHPSTLVGNITNMAAGRISRQLDLKGPSLVIDTACSSSLVAVHSACESLYSGECEMAFAGGVNLNFASSAYGYFEAAGPLSPTGHCRPFSAAADGFVMGEGAGFVLLKPVQDALSDGDPILAVIRGSAVNNDGRSIGLMAPSLRGQIACLEQAYERSGFDPGLITAIEAHGTGTRLGDAIEIATLSRFFGDAGADVTIGSVKANIGHLITAAGIAGLMRLVLSLMHRRLPPTVHFDGGNPKWKLGEKGLTVLQGPQAWDAPFPRAAGVNSFGFGGTNCHVILEEAPEPVAAELRAPLERPRFDRKYFHFAGPSGNGAVVDVPAERSRRVGL